MTVRTNDIEDSDFTEEELDIIYGTNHAGSSAERSHA